MKYQSFTYCYGEPFQMATRSVFRLPNVIRRDAAGSLAMAGHFCHIPRPSRRPSDAN